MKKTIWFLIAAEVFNLLLIAFLVALAYKAGVKDGKRRIEESSQATNV